MFSCINLHVLPKYINQEGTFYPYRKDPLYDRVYPAVTVSFHVNECTVLFNLLAIFSSNNYCKFNPRKLTNITITDLTYCPNFPINLFFNRS